VSLGKKKKTKLGGTPGGKKKFFTLFNFFVWSFKVENFNLGGTVLLVFQKKKTLKKKKKLKIFKPREFIFLGGFFYLMPFFSPVKGGALYPQKNGGKGENSGKKKKKKKKIFLIYNFFSRGKIP